MSRVMLQNIAASAHAFAVAQCHLVAQDKARGGDGRLRDTEAALCENGRTVLLFPDYEDDARTLCVSFDLLKPMREEEFNAEFFRDLLEDN